MEDRVARSAIPALLLAWYDVHARDLPWRIPPGANGAVPDPYRVWLSEVMLQQTTTAAVAPYFARFTARWPTVEALAAAPAEDVMAEWAGLGYYSRARNLVASAQKVAGEGGFPDSEVELRKLPGVGDYTAAAIAAIAFGRRAVVVDANIERVISRLFAISQPLPSARQAIRTAADRVTPDHRAGDFAQGLMDLGATICTSRAPRCLLCPLAECCEGRKLGVQETLPVKAAKKAKPQRRGMAWWIERDGKVLTVTRPGKGLLGGMRALPDDGWSAWQDGSGMPPIAANWQQIGTVRHGFTHFALELDVHRHETTGSDKLPEGTWFALRDLETAGFPTLFAKAAQLAVARGHASLEDAAAQHQANNGDGEHDHAEVPPAVRTR